MTVRLLLFGDTHLGFDLPVRPRAIRRRRGEDFFANLERVLDAALRLRVDAVVHGGDLFFRSRVPPAIVDRVYARLRAFADRGVPLYIVPGNHERSRLPPSLFLSHPGLFVFDRPRAFTLDVRGARLCLAGFPYLDDVGARFLSLQRALADETRAADVSVLCCHHAFEGAVVGAGDAGEHVFRDASDVVRARDVDGRFAAVLSGHIHRRQVVDTGGPPVVYAGSVERTSFVERREPKGFFVVELDGGPPRAEQLRFSRLPARPMHVVALPALRTAAGARAALEEAFAALEHDAVVQLRAADEPSLAFLDAATVRAAAREGRSVDVRLQRSAASESLWH